jgi:hypothetical protein
MLTWDYIDMWVGLTVSHRLANAYASLCRASFGKSQCSLDAMLGALNLILGSSQVWLKDRQRPLVWRMQQKQAPTGTPFTTDQESLQWSERWRRMGKEK